MKSSYDLIQRIIYVDLKLRDDKPLNCTQLAKHFGVDRKTALKVIDYMKKEMDAPIGFKPKMRCYYYLHKNFSLPAINLSEGELFSLLVAEKAIKLYENTPYEDDLKKIYSRISKFLTDNKKFYNSEDISKIHFSPDVKSEINKEIYDSVSQALRDENELEIKYYSLTKDETTTRVVQPYFLMTKHGDWYLVGFCKFRNEIRYFAIQRIKEALVLEETFCKDEELEKEMRKYIGDGLDIAFGKGEWDIEIKIDFPKSVVIQERKWHPTQKIKQNKDRSVNISFRLNSLQEVKRWILGLGTSATVIKPKILLDDLKKEVAELAKKYK